MKKIYVFLLGVLCVFSLSAQTTFTFDNLTVPDTGFWNGADSSVYNHFFGDETIVFPNNYNTNYGSWDGFAFSTWTDTVTEGYANQWSVYSGGAHSGDVFGLAYVPVDWTNSDYPTIPININFNQAVQIDSLFITNSTYTALAVKNGTAYSDPFSTDSSDYLMLIIYLINNNDTIDTVNFYLADYTTSTPVVVQDWQKIDFTASAKAGRTVTKLAFDMVTTDVGSYGPNTPLYFCLDDISYSPATTIVSNMNDFDVKVFPNPASSFVSLNNDFENVSVYSIDGKEIKTITNYAKNQSIDINGLNAGTYIIQAKNNNSIKFAKFVKL